MDSPVTATRLPSVDRVLRSQSLASLRQRYGHRAVVAAIREALAELRSARADGLRPVDEDAVAAAAATRLIARLAPKLRRVFNLTGTVLHTNLGRAVLSEAAIMHTVMAMRHPCSLEYDLGGAGRGDRDTLIEELLVELTGAEAATVVNNNAAAVLIMLAALAEGREIVVSRGELVEIGGSFRMPDVMRSAHVRLVEVGATNRTHPRDYRAAIGPETAALMKVHTSNYRITGFVAEVGEGELAEIAHEHGLPLLLDLGAGSLIDLSLHGLPREPVVREVVATGADVVTFSGDKLLGGPQAGIIVGREDLIERIRCHPLKRALRQSKLTLAALEATLLGYRTPDLLACELPTLRMLTRSTAELEALAGRVQPTLEGVLGDEWIVVRCATASQVGSGSLPEQSLPSVALALQPRDRSDRSLQALASKLRRLPVPVIGRVEGNRLLLDLRCLDGEEEFTSQLALLRLLP